MANVRADLLVLMQQTIADRAHWTYLFARPIWPAPYWHPGQDVRVDCSKGVQSLCRWAGAPDPMGNDWAGWGNSATICAHLHHLDWTTQLEVGDIITFGPWGDAHATMVMEKGFDPLLWSMGHQGAPDTYRLSQDVRERQFLRLPVAPIIVSPIDVLRQKTGWWAWLAWHLGEGDWAKYGKANPKVRPNVPGVIPLSWWVMLARFLHARKRGNPPKGAL